MPNQYTAKWTEQEKEVLLRNYSALPKDELQQMLPNRTWKAIMRMAHVLKCTGRPNNQRIRGYNAKRKVNVDFFKEIGNKQAYVFGRLLTDGSWRLRRSGGEARLKSIDLENLEKIRFVMGSDHKISKVKTPKGTWIYILDIYSNEIVRDLRKLEEEIMRFTINPHFLRGLIDGDGAILIDKHKVLKVVFYNNDRQLMENIKRAWSGTIYEYKGKTLMLIWQGEEAEKLLSQIYGESLPFLCIARKYSRWQLYRAMKGLLTVV